MSNSPNENGTGAAQQAEQLKTRVVELMDLLRSQRKILQQKGMNLPSGSLDNLRTLKTRIENVSKQLGTAFIELQSLRAVAENTALINSALDTDVVLERVMDKAIDLTGAERGYIVLKNRQTGEIDEFRVAQGFTSEGASPFGGGMGGRGDEPTGTTGKSDFIVSRSIINQVAMTGNPVLTDNASENPDWQNQQSIVNFALRSILAVPLKVRGELIGVVYCDNRVMAGLFREIERDILAAFADQAAVAIENARLFETIRAQLQQITEMRDLMNNIFDSIISGVVTVNNDGYVMMSNTAADHILGVAGARGKHLQEVLPPLDNLFYDILTDIMHGGQQQAVEVEPIINDKPRIWNVIASPLRDDQGIALVIDDLTEQKARESQLAEVSRFLPLALIENIRSIEDLNIGGQERIISMIATDVRGFTRFSENLQPEELMQIINQYLAVASDGINLYEGIVDKYMGDAVTGFFNTQLNPQEDHAVRAVRAAMSIIYDLYGLHDVLPEEQHLYYGIGIHTGSAYLGNVGSPDRKEFSALGDAATISKILESNAGPGEVLISQSTYEQVKDVFECEQRIIENNKGRDDLKIAYKVNRRKKGVTTGALVLDPELAELLKDLGSDNN